MALLVTVYWLWFGVSLAIIARRVVRKLWRAPANERPVTSAASGAGIAPAADRAPFPAPSSTPSALPDTASFPAAGAAPAVAVAPSALTARSAVPRPDRSPVAGTRTSLAEALAGIRMPLDLAPLSHLAGTDADRRLVLATSGCPVAAVDAALTEELERLGFAIERTGPADVLAHRGPHAVALHMRTIGLTTSGAPADPAYPTAPAGSVVVDVQLR